MRDRLLIALAGVIAVAVRFRRLAWELDAGMSLPDEVIFWGKPAASFIPLSWSSFSTDVLNYPTLYLYLTGLATAAAQAAGFLSPPRGTPEEIVFVARVVSASAGVVTVLLTGWLGARWYSARTGVLAAALMAVVPLEVAQAHFASVDVLLTTCGVLTLAAAATLATSGRAAAALVAGAAAGLGCATKYTGIVFLASALWAVLEVVARQRSLRPLIVLGGLVLVGFGMAFALACPPCVIHTDRVRYWIGWLSGIDPRTHAAFLCNHLVPGLGWYGRPYLYQLVASLPYVLGWPLYAAALGGVVAAAWRHQPIDRLLLVAALASFGSIGALQVTPPRYLLPLLPALVLLAARLLAGNLAWSRPRAAAFAVVWLYTFALTGSHVARFSFRQQHELAVWLRDRLAPTAGDRRPLVLVPGRLGMNFFGLWPLLEQTGLDPQPVVMGKWDRPGAAALVLPDFYANSLRRDQPGAVFEEPLALLESGATPFRPARRWESRFLTQSLYTALDPCFSHASGDVGFTVYLREPRPGT